MFVVSSKLLIYKYWIEQNLSTIILSEKSRKLIVNVVIIHRRLINKFAYPYKTVTWKFRLLQDRDLSNSFSTIVSKLDNFTAVYCTELKSQSKAGLT